MSVIVELTVPTDAFELGQILCVESDIQVTLETVVRLGGQLTPFVRVKSDDRERFERTINEYRSVRHINLVTMHDDERLYAVDCTASENSLISTLFERDITLLHAIGTVDDWTFELKFPTHDSFATFRAYCADEGIRVTVTRMYNTTEPHAGPWYGLTPTQRETLAHAVSAGYYAIPREVSTKEIAAEFDISDQAATERLRRGIKTLVSNTLLATDNRGDRN